MAAVLSRNITDIKKIGFFMDECRRMGISVLGPCVNESTLKFTVNKDGDIRFGLGAIKGVGESAVEMMVDERKKSGNFLDIYDFVERNKLSSITRKTMEALAISGAFDSLGEISRRQYVEVEDNEATLIERLIKYGNKHQFEKDTPQQNLFGEMSQGTIAKPEPPDIDEWHLLDKINREKELIGMYLTAHPLDRFKTEIDSFCTTNLHEMNDLKALSGRDFTFCGIVKTIRDTVDQWRNKPYLMAMVEDFTESYTIRLRGDDYVKFKHFFNQEIALLIRASVNEWRPRDEPGKIVYSLKIKHINLMSEVKEKIVKAVDLNIPLASINEKLMDDLEKFTVPSEGKILKINISDPESNIKLNLFSRNKQVDVTSEFIDFLNDIPELEFKLV
jgi:DNA polymerase III subunit alpha